MYLKIITYRSLQMLKYMSGTTNYGNGGFGF